MSTWWSRRALNAYDIVALIPIVEGAGGIVTGWDGGDPSKGGAIVAAGDRHVHEQALAALRDGDRRLVRRGGNGTARTLAVPP